MTPIQLRPDQAALNSDIDAAYRAGAQNVLGVLPTGGGKSIIVSHRVLEQHNQGACQLVAAHRNELVSQMSMHVARRGIKHRIIASKQTVSQIIAEHRAEFNGVSYVNPDSRCAVSSVQTLNARAEELRPWAQQVEWWTLDEAHHLTATNAFGQAMSMFPRARGLGVTASPRRADGMGLGRHADGLMDAMCIGPDMRSLINLDALCDYEIVIPEGDFAIDDADLAPSGDWSTKKMREASKKSHIVGDVVKEYVKNSFGKRGICFATDVETSAEIAANFNAVGIPAASVSAKTPSDVRAEYVRRLRDGRLRILVNVDLFGEGFDLPSIEVVIMARPTASLAVYLQQFGRALRTLQGKQFGTVIDHVSNWKRHSFPDKAHYWTLDRRDKRAKREPDPELEELTACRGCSRPYLRYLPACPKCGWSPPLPAPGGRTIEMVDGDLMLLDRDKLAAMRAATVLESPASVAARVGAVAGAVAGAGAANASIARHDAQSRLRAAVEQYAGVGRAKGRSEQEIMKRFYAASGVDVLTCYSLPRPEMEALAAKVEGWCYA